MSVMSATSEAAATLSERFRANKRRCGSRPAAATSDAACGLGSQA
jgi:hypothetical protein